MTSGRPALWKKYFTLFSAGVAFGSLWTWGPRHVDPKYQQFHGHWSLTSFLLVMLLLNPFLHFPLPQKDFTLPKRAVIALPECPGQLFVCCLSFLTVYLFDCCVYLFDWPVCLCLSTLPMKAVVALPWCPGQSAQDLEQHVRSELV